MCTDVCVGKERDGQTGSTWVIERLIARARKCALWPIWLLSFSLSFSSGLPSAESFCAVSRRSNINTNMVVCT